MSSQAGKHPGEEVGYILTGTVSMRIRDHTALALHCGNGFRIPPSVAHNAPDVGADTRTHALHLPRRNRHAVRRFHEMTMTTRRDIPRHLSRNN